MKRETLNIHLDALLSRRSVWFGNIYFCGQTNQIIINVVIYLPAKISVFYFLTRNYIVECSFLLITYSFSQGEGQQLVKLAAVNSRPRSSQERKQSPPVVTITDLEHKLRKKVIK